jgi:hypothetical protein
MFEAALASDPGLLAELDKLIFGEKPRYEAAEFLNFLFCIPASAADRADGDTLAFRRRNKDERFIVLLAPEDHGVFPSEPEITPAMIEAGAAGLCLFDMREDRPGDAVYEVYRVMPCLEGRAPPGPGKTLSRQAEGLFATEGDASTYQVALRDKGFAIAVGAVAMQGEIAGWAE